MAFYNTIYVLCIRRTSSSRRASICISTVHMCPLTSGTRSPYPVRQTTSNSGLEFTSYQARRWWRCPDPEHCPTASSGGMCEWHIYMNTIVLLQICAFTKSAVCNCNMYEQFRCGYDMKKSKSELSFTSQIEMISCYFVLVS